MNSSEIVVRSQQRTLFERQSEQPNIQSPHQAGALPSQSMNGKPLREKRKGILFMIYPALPSSSGLDADPRN